MEEGNRTKKAKVMGKIRVGRLLHDSKKKDTHTSIEGYKTIIIKNYKTGLGASLSPYFLKNDEGHLHENIWQFSKVYPKVHKQRQYVSRFHYGKPEYLVWEWPEEVHFENDQVTDAFWKWRKAGFENEKAVRYPNGFQHRGECKFSLWKNEKGEWERLDYVKARAKIYAAVYEELAKKDDDFKKIKSLLEKGENILLIDVDGPKYSEQAPYNLTKDDSIEINEETLPLLLKNTSQPFCHCYVLAGALLGLEYVWRSVK